MPRRRAIALIVATRRSILANADERLPSDAQRAHNEAAQLERLLLDVRACRLDAFELGQPPHTHVTVSAD